MSLRHDSLRGAGACALVLLLVGCRLNVNSDKLSVLENRTFTVANRPQIELSTFHGNIEIQSWSRANVEIEIQKIAMEPSLIEQIKVEALQDGDKLLLNVTGPPRTAFSGVTLGVHVDPTARLRVSVPRLSNITARSDSGSIRVTSVDGKIALNASDGSVTANRLAGQIQVRTGDGAIRLDEVAGALDLETQNGRITVNGRPSVLRLRTGKGSVRARLAADTVMTDAWDLLTRDGRVTIELPFIFSADLDAETSNGSVRTSNLHTGDILGGGGEPRSRSRVMRARLGDGGKTLRVRTGDGTIRIAR